ncbi:MAG: hypothetical protein HY617_02465 [Candidatus Sungbacteria bacterium]|nr:hypothetical protein [Candidatus Sungbacteria bacterium]
MRPFRQIWRIQSSTYEISRGPVDAIIVPSYGMCKDRLPEMSQHSIRLGIWWQTTHFPNASLIVTTCSYTGEALEWQLKRYLLDDLKFPEQKVIWVRSIDSTIDEGDKVLASIVWAVKGILGITGDTHSRSFYNLYAKLFPQAKIFVDCIPFEFEFQPDHLITDQTTAGKWARSALIREFVFQMPFGFWIARHAPHHKIKN